MEQYVRTKIDTQLANLGWVLNGAKRNVFLEEPRTSEEKRTLHGKRPDYVLYSADRSIYEPIAIIETKSSKTKGLDGAVDQATDYADKLHAPFVFATDGAFLKTFHLKSNSFLTLNGEEVHNLLQEPVALLFRDTPDVDTRPKEVVKSLESLIEDFDEVNKILRKEGLTAGWQRFSEFATILFLKLFSEKEALSQAPRITAIHSWEHLQKLNSEDYLSHIQSVIFPKIKELYSGDNIFPNKLEINNPVIFKEIYDKISHLKLTYINEDIKGAAFEYFIAKSPSADKDLGEYFTPRHIIRAMVAMLDPQLGEKIYDPFCGTGGMLIESFKHIRKNMTPSKANMSRLEHDTIFGGEITSNARIAKMNMILAGGGHSGIKQGDSLAPENLAEIENKYNIVISNIPFSQQTDWSTYYDIPSNSGDSICLQHCIKALKPGGRMAIIVPEGLLFKKEHAKTREYLFHHCDVVDVISLPQGAFLPYTPSKASILHCVKKKSSSPVWFFDVENDGYALNMHRWKIPGRDDLDKFLSFRRVAEKDKTEFGFLPVKESVLKQNDYALWAYRYLGNDKAVKDSALLEEILDIRCGDRITQKEDRGTLYPVYGGGGISFYTDQSNCSDAIVISRFAMSEKCVRYVKDKFWLLDSGFTVSIKKEFRDEISDEFLFYMLRNMEKNIFRCGRGIAQKNIDFDFFNSLRIPILKSKKEREQFVATMLELERSINLHEYQINKVRNLMQHKIDTVDFTPADILSNSATFEKLFQGWRNEIAGHSSPESIVLNDNYLRIIAMGEAAIPFLLEEIKKKPINVFRALRVLAHHDPVKLEDEGNMKAMSKAWLDWGRENNLIK